MRGSILVDTPPITCVANYYFSHLHLAEKQRHTRAERRAPTNGAATKIQSCSRAAPPANKAGPIERAGLTEVPVIPIHTRCTNTKVRPIKKPARSPAPRSESVVANTTNTKINVNTNSAIKPCSTVISPCKPLAPRPLSGAR